MPAAAGARDRRRAAVRELRDVAAASGVAVTRRHPDLTPAAFEALAQAASYASPDYAEGLAAVKAKRKPSF